MFERPDCVEAAQERNVSEARFIAAIDVESFRAAKRAIEIWNIQAQPKSRRDVVSDQQRCGRAVAILIDRIADVLAIFLERAGMCKLLGKTYVPPALVF